MFVGRADAAVQALPSMPVFPRCVAEQLASTTTPPPTAPWVEDDRGSWHGVPGATMPPDVRYSVRAVIIDDGHLAVIERERDGDRYFALPGGTIEHDELPEDAAAREVAEELGLTVSVGTRLAVVVFRLGDQTSLQTYLWCTVVGGTFGTGTGDEYTSERAAQRGTYTPRWLDMADLPPNVRPAWIRDRIPAWRANPAPVRPERFCEFHDG